MNKKTYSWNNWADVLKPLAGTESMATFSDQFYKSKSAATLAKIGKGTVSYIGVDTDNGAFEKECLFQMFNKISIKVNKLADGLMLDWRDGFWVAINYSTNHQIKVEIPKNAKIIFGKRLLNPAEVLVWE